MIACLGMFRSTALVCDRCAWRNSCSTGTAACSGPWDGEVYTDTNAAYCPDSGVYTSTTQVETQASESEEVDEPKVVPAYLPYPAQRLVVDRRKYVLITAPRRLQRGRNR